MTLHLSPVSTKIPVIQFPNPLVFSRYSSFDSLTQAIKESTKKQRASASNCTAVRAARLSCHPYEHPRMHGDADMKAYRDSRDFLRKMLYSWVLTVNIGWKVDPINNKIAAGSISMLYLCSSELKLEFILPKIRENLGQVKQLQQMNKLCRNGQYNLNHILRLNVSFLFFSSLKALQSSTS